MPTESINPDPEFVVIWLESGDLVGRFMASGELFGTSSGLGSEDLDAEDGFGGTFFDSYEVPFSASWPRYDCVTVSL